MMAKRILVPIGRDERAETILPLVAGLARDAGATVRLLQIQPTQRTAFDEFARKSAQYGYDAETILQVRQRVLDYAHAREERLGSETLDRLRQLEPLLDGVTVERRVRFGDVVDEIVREAEAFDADLVAVSARRRPWWRPALAPVGDRVRRRVRVAVLTLSETGR
jgi:nucleotide-binding universal stress UspA family protein